MRRLPAGRWLGTALLFPVALLCNSGGVMSASPPPSPTAILAVGNAGALSAGERLLEARLQAAGYVVLARDGGSFSSWEAQAAAVVVLSPMSSVLTAVSNPTSC